MVSGKATAKGTARFATRRQAASAEPDAKPALPSHFRVTPGDGLTLSSIGLGTYLGSPDPATDRGYAECLRLALACGCNVVDTAINYRFQRSERAVGEALADLIKKKLVARDEVYVSTKGGYVPFDGRRPGDGEAWIEESYVRRGIARREDFVGTHCIAPAYLRDQIGCSRQNLGLDRIDLYYVHNPEGQRPIVGPKDFARKMHLAFEEMEAAVARGEIGSYGAATWNGFRQPPTAREHLSLAELVAIAKVVGGNKHHFRAVQAPLNVKMPELVRSKTQDVDGERLTLLEAAERLGIAVFASASIHQGRLAAGLDRNVKRYCTGLTSDAQRALQLVRSSSGLTTALVGMSKPEHARENLALVAIPPLDPKAALPAFR